MTLNHTATFFHHAVIHKIGLIRRPLLSLLECQEDLEQSCRKTRAMQVSPQSLHWLHTMRLPHGPPCSQGQPAPSSHESPSQQTSKVFSHKTPTGLVSPHFTCEKAESRKQQVRPAPNRKMTRESTAGSPSQLFSLRPAGSRSPSTPQTRGTHTGPLLLMVPDRLPTRDLQDSARCTAPPERPPSSHKEGTTWRRLPTLPHFCQVQLATCHLSDLL